MHKMDTKELDTYNLLKKEVEEEDGSDDIKGDYEESGLTFPVKKKEKKGLDYFECTRCNLKIVKSSFFVQHVENEHGGDQFPCSLCNLQFYSGQMFTDHVKITHRNKGGLKKVLQAFFKCKYCDQKTVKSTFYVKHMSSEHPGHTLHCSFCELQFENGELFIDHVKSFHKKNKGKVVNQDEVFPCAECKKIFSKLSNLEGHNRAVHNIQVQVCEFCCKEFKNKDYCRQHIRLVHESQFLENVVCDICSKVFKSKSNLYHHKRAVHEKAEDLICYICATKCKNSYGLRKHLKKCQVRAKREPKTYVLGKDTHIQQQGEHFFCSQCNKTFFTPKALRSHNRAAHTFDPVNCHICSKECKNVDYLKQHYRRGHYITDAEQVAAMVKFVKPDFEPGNSKKKEKDPNYGTEVKPGIDWNFDMLNTSGKPPPTNSESQKIRQELVSKWRVMEEEQRRQKEEALKPLHCESDLMLGNFEEDMFSNLDEINPGFLPDCDIKAPSAFGEDPSPQLKLEDDENLLPECEVKLEASGSECSSNANLNDFGSSSEDEKKTIKANIPKDVGTFACEECNKSFKSMKYLTSHVRTVHTVEPCSCPQCNTNFKNQRYLSQHLQRAHKIDSKSAKEQSLRSLKDETESRIKPEIKIEGANNSSVADDQTNLACTDCSKVFSTKSRLATHVSNMHVVGEYLCQLCGEKFTLKQQLKNHAEKAHAKADGVCQFCSKTFKHLSSHIKDVHMKDECICPHCAKTFHNKKHLNGHLATVHSGEGQTRICPVCSKQFKNSQYLRQHVRLVHETVEDLTNYITCQECGKQFANKAHLYHHTKAVHVIESCNCKLCGRTYKNKIALGKHMKHAHDGMVKNPYSGGVKPVSPEPESMQVAPGLTVSPQFISTEPRLDAFPRAFFGQPGWY